MASTFTFFQESKSLAGKVLGLVVFAQSFVYIFPIDRAKVPDARVNKGHT